MWFKVLTLFGLLMLNTSIYGQVKGKAIYEISYEAQSPELEGVGQQLPTKCIYFGDGNSWKVIWRNKVGGDYAIIYNYALDSLTHLVSAGARQLSVAHNEDELKYFSVGASNFKVENRGIVSTYKLLKHDDVVLDETYFQIPSAFTPLSREKYLRLLR